MAIDLAPLPFDYGDLEPFLSSEALLLHYDTYHRRYTEQLNVAIQGTRFSHMSLDEIICKADGLIFKNAAQVWNHNFYWRCLAPHQGGRPSARLLDAIDTHFETFENFQNEFKRVASGNFASGWTWLVYTSNGKLKIINTRDAGTPLVDWNTKPLLTLDVWEHAYYVDYQARTTEYVDNFWCFVNWHFVNHNFKSTFR